MPDSAKADAVSPRYGRGFALTDRADKLASAYPPLLIEADRIAHTVALGLHGRRRSGVGETFWQFRRFTSGDETQRIDWRRSARSDKLYIRENEWEAANTVWIWTDLSPGMEFKSHLAAATKRERGMILALALASLALRAGERVGFVGSQHAPSHHRNALRHHATWLSAATETGTPAWPSPERLHRFSRIVLFSDFLEPIETIAHRLAPVAERDIQGHLLQILDPAEEDLPYTGRKEFAEIGGTLQVMIGRVESVRETYQARMQAHRRRVEELAQRLGWTFGVHRTDQSPQTALLALYTLLSGDRRTGAVALNRS